MESKSQVASMTMKDCSNPAFEARIGLAWALHVHIELQF